MSRSRRDETRDRLRHLRFIRMATVVLLGLASPVLVAQSCNGGFLINFPSRADWFDDHDGVYLNTSGHVGEEDGVNGIDFGAVRWDGNGWTNVVEDPGETLELDDILVYGVPLYAPADGLVITCWRNMPEPSDPAVNGYDQDPTGKIIAGNHLNIMTENGDHVILLAHLQPGSIPSHLCPIARDVITDDDEECELGEGWSGYYDDIRLDGVVPFPEVKKGDFLGRVGHSGNSEGPHLHLHVKPLAWDAAGNPCEADSVPMHFTESWIQPQSSDGPATASGWDRLARTPLPTVGDTGAYLLWPDPIGPRMDDVQLGVASEIHLAADRIGGVIAYRDEDGNLTLESFRLTDSGAIEMQGSDGGAGSGELELAHPVSNSRSVVVALRDANDDLEVIGFHVDADGNIERGGEIEAKTASHVQVTPSPNHAGVVVGMRDGGGQTRIIDFFVDPDTMVPTRPPISYAAAAGRGYLGGLATLRKGLAFSETAEGREPFEGVVSAEWDPDVGALYLRTWSVTPEGRVKHRDSLGVPVFFGAVEGADVSVVDVGGREVVVLTYRTGGVLRLRSFEVSSSGTLLLEDMDAAGAIFAPLAAATVRHEQSGRSETLVAVRDDDENLRLISWGVDPYGSLRRSGTRRFGFAWEVAAAATTPVMNESLVVAATNEDDELKLIHLRVNFDPLR